MQPYQAYLKLHGNKVNLIISEKYKRHCKGLPTGEKPETWICFHHREAKEMLAQEPKEVRDAVESFQNEPQTDSDMTAEQKKVLHTVKYVR